MVFLIDSSVAPGMTINRHNGKEPDFSMISSNEIYSFSNQIEKKECGGEFLEVPITTCKMTIFDKIANRFYINRHNMEFIPFADGTHSRVVMRKQSRIYRMLNFIKYCLIPNRIMFSMTRISPNIILQKSFVFTRKDSCIYRSSKRYVSFKYQGGSEIERARNFCYI